MDGEGALEREESTDWVAICEVDDAAVPGLVVQHPGVGASKISSMTCRGEMFGDLRLHPSKPIFDVVIWEYLMHEVHGLFLEDPGPVVDAVVHVGDEEMGQI